MTEFDLLELIGQADDQYIMESRRRPRKKPHRAKWPYALAACLVLAAIGIPAARSLSRGMGTAASGQEPQVVAQAPDTQTQTSEAAGAPAADTAEAAESAGTATLLAAAEYPAAISLDDADGASRNWTENQTSQETKTALNSFSYALAAQTLAGGTQSGCISPLSLYQTLSVLASGAEGQTRSQLLSLLGQSDLETLAEQAGKLYRVNYADNEVDTLKISNSLWLDDQDGALQYHQDWVMAAARDYYTDVFEAEFQSPETAQALGQWIAERTGGMLSPSPEALGLDPETVMAIVNTLWFKTQWMEPFDQEDTSPGDFTTQDGQTVSTDFMHQTTYGGQVIQTQQYTKSYLPLERGRMILVLPAEGVDLDSLLTEETLWEIFENGDYTYADVVWSVPKFETSVTYDLKGTLQALGVTDAFGEAADFSPISDTPLYLNQIQQGTHISVNEDGVEAAAYSMAAMMAGAAAPETLPTVEMNLNRPFLYLITAQDGSTLFMGAVRTPQD